MQGGGGGGPVDGGHRGGAAGAVADEPAREVVAVQEGAVADKQFGACFERVEAGGGRPEGSGELVSVRVGLRVLSGWRR